MSKNLAELVNELNRLSKKERTQFRDLIVHSGECAELHGNIDATGMEVLQRLDEEESATEARRGLAS